MKNLLKKQSGSALVSLIIVLPFLMLISYHSTQLSVANLQIAKKDQTHTHAQLAVDAGIDIAVKEINDDTSWGGTSSPVELHNDGSVRTTYEVSVTTNSTTSKTLTTTGKAYAPASSSTPASTVKVKTDLRGITSGSYSIVSGVGGLFLSNSAKVIGGDVFVNGEVNLRNSSQIGLSTNPVNVSVAHQTCPNPATASYPSLCGAGENGQPITILNTARIFGSVSANNQTNGASMSSPGLVSGSGVVPQTMPPHDRAGQKAAIASTVTAATAGCSSGTKTWAANLRITGNVTISGSCQVTVLGDVWITGTLTLRNSAKLIVSDSLNTTRPNLMVDGNSASFSNTSELKSNSSSTGFQVINYWSTASCSPDCADVTGTDLYNSRDDETISLSNSSSGPQTVFYSRWSKVSVNNSGSIGALVGQIVELKNSSTITFGTSVSVGGETSWVVDGYRRNFQ